MDDSAIDNAEVTLFYEKVKYRDQNGNEKEAFRFKPYGMVRFNERGQERDYVTPIHISHGLQLENEDIGNKPGALRFLLEPAPVEDEKNWMHSFGNV